MSVKMVKYVFDLSPATGADRLVLLSLAERASADGVCWPSNADTARRTKLCKRAVQYSIRRLEDSGELRCIRSGGGRSQTGRGYTTTFLIVAGRDVVTLEKIAAKVHKCAPLARGYSAKDGKVECTSGQATVHPDAEKGASPCTRTVRKPPENHQGEPVLVLTDRLASRSDNLGRSATVTSRLDRILRQSNSGAAELSQRNSPVVRSEIIMILGDRGCDESFRQAVSQYTDVRVVRQLAREYDYASSKGKIRNSGGWWRDRLRRLGVKGL